MAINQIGTMTELRESLVPTGWQITQYNDGSYVLGVSYQQEGAIEAYMLIETSRYEVKKYKSIKAVFSDITRVTPKATIQFMQSARERPAFKSN